MRVKHKPWAKDYIKENNNFFLSEEVLNGGNPFDNDNPIHLELGMGKGQFIMELAKQNPEINYIGVELQASAQVMAGKKLEEEPLPNVRLYNQDVAKLLEHEFWVGNIDRIYLNFSDPWPKNRHAKRRLTSDRFTPIYDQLLSANGSIHQKTDSKSLFESSVMSLTQNGYEIVDIELDMHNSDRPNIITEYEEKFSKKGFTIKFLEAKKRK
ncbi:tRNA (guanosine(46)-N7)-methyltransferase TrmB [Mollicutes bacterium LVI A0078]|nr:tRNA (guanosine(46)-N7)-methyltransferase TrmB [Mollicutes bacterium LVI A0075]WOO90698.1 tRNA (guanosine(46)-N7)-methyltransferase TrmB [Mollicutes bacterium LVI A0078]